MGQGYYPGDNNNNDYRVVSPIAGGNDDPRVEATLGKQGTLYVQFGTQNVFHKQDDGKTINWNLLSFGGGLKLQGNWDANLNLPDLPSLPLLANAGNFWIVSVPGATSLGGITAWNLGDWAVCTGTTWIKVDNQIYANKTLSNLTAPTNINADLIPLSLKKLGSMADYWEYLYCSVATAWTINLYTRFLGSRAFTIKPENVSNGLTYGTVIKSYVITGSAYKGLCIVTEEGLSAVSEKIRIETGDAGATSNLGSGDIEIKTGLPNGIGVRGKLVLDGRFIDASSKNISNVLDPILAQDAATKNYVDNYIAFVPSVTVYVDKNRTDIYVEDGTIYYPYKNIEDAQDAILDASDDKRYCVQIAGGRYREKLTLKPFVNLTSLAPDAVQILANDGDVITAPSAMNYSSADLTNIIVIYDGIDVNHTPLRILAKGSVNSQNSNFFSASGEGCVLEGDGGLVASNSGFSGCTNGILLKDTSWAGFNNCTFSGLDGTFFDVKAEIGTWVSMAPDNQLYNGTKQILGTIETKCPASFMKNDSSVVGATVKDALDSLGSSSGAPVFSNMIFVDVNGNDITGTGTILKPFATGYKAMSVITDALPTKRYAIKYGVGFFTEVNNIVHKPNVWIMGSGPYVSRVIFSGVYSLDATFAGTADNRFGFSDIYIDGILTVNMLGVTATNARMYNRNCQFNKAISFTAYAATSRFYLFNCETFSTASLNGGYIHSMFSVFNGLLTIGSSANNYGNGMITHSYLPNGLTVTSNGGTESMDCWLYNSQVRATLTVALTAGLHYGLGCLPPPYSRAFSPTATINCQGMDDITRINAVRRSITTTPFYVNGNDDYLLGVDTTSAKTIYMPNTSTYDGFTPITIKDETGLAATNPITIARSGAVDTFEGTTSLTINTAYGFVTLYKAAVGKWCKI